MLARVNRVRSGSEFRQSIRRGRKAVTPTVVAYGRRGGDDVPPRFGIIVSKAVGGAVTRNLAKRRLRAIAHEMLPELSPGWVLIVRVLPAAAEAGWDTLREQATEAVRRVVRA